MGRTTGEDRFTHMDKELGFDRLISNMNNVLLQNASDPGGQYSHVLL